MNKTGHNTRQMDASRMSTFEQQSEKSVDIGVPAYQSADTGADVDLDSADLYLNRELTWLAFNRRVLKSWPKHQRRSSNGSSSWPLSATIWMSFS